MAFQKLACTTHILAGTLLLTLTAAVSSAQSLVRSYGSGAGTVNGISVIGLGNNQIITAMVNGSGNLELICWWNDPVAHSLSRQGSYVGGLVEANRPLPSTGFVGAFNVQEVALAAINQSQFVTAIRDSNGFLELIVFDVNNAEGQIIRQGTAYTEGAPYFSQIGSLALADLDANRVVAVTADSVGSTAAVSIWSVNGSGNISEQGYTPWTLTTGGGAVGVVAVSTDLIVVGQTGACPCTYGAGSTHPLALTSFSVNTNGWLTELQQVFPGGMPGSAQDLSFRMANLGGGNFVLAFVNDFYESMNLSAGGYMSVSEWQDSNGYLTLYASTQPFVADTVAVASIDGIAFTITSGDVFWWGNWGSILYPEEAYPEAVAWYGQNAGTYMPAAGVVDSQFTCVYPEWTYNEVPPSGLPCYASAASLPTGQAATAMSDSYGYLHVDIWNFTGPY